MRLCPDAGTRTAVAWGIARRYQRKGAYEARLKSATIVMLSL
jgi:hypothetical protein